MRIAEICNHNVIHVGRGASIREAAEAMRRNHVGAVLVTERPNGEEIAIGIVTDRDIVLSVVAGGVRAEDITVTDVMSRSLVSCGEDADMLDVLQTMRSKGIRRVPVLNDIGGLVGIVTADDILGALSAHLMELTGALTREQSNEMARRA